MLWTDETVNQWQYVYSVDTKHYCCVVQWNMLLTEMKQIFILLHV